MKFFFTSSSWKSLHLGPKLEESEYEELIRLRAENEYIKAEIQVINKEIALREEKEAARLKAKKQRSSKNSEKKDTNWSIFYKPWDFLAPPIIMRYPEQIP